MRSADAHEDDCHLEINIVYVYVEGTLCEEMECTVEAQRPPTAGATRRVLWPQQTAASWSVSLESPHAVREYCSSECYDII